MLLASVVLPTHGCPTFRNTGQRQGGGLAWGETERQDDAGKAMERSTTGMAIGGKDEHAGPSPCSGMATSKPVTG